MTAIKNRSLDIQTDRRVKQKNSGGGKTNEVSGAVDRIVKGKHGKRYPCDCIFYSYTMVTVLTDRRQVDSRGGKKGLNQLHYFTLVVFFLSEKSHITEINC